MFFEFLLNGLFKDYLKTEGCIDLEKKTRVQLVSRVLVFRKQPCNEEGQHPATHHSVKLIKKHLKIATKTPHVLAV